MDPKFREEKKKTLDEERSPSRYTHAVNTSKIEFCLLDRRKKCPTGNEEYRARGDGHIKYMCEVMQWSSHGSIEAK